MSRILVVSQHYWPENFRVTDLCEGLVAQGIQVDVLCGLPNYPLGKWYEGYRYTGPRRQEHNGVNIIRAGEIPRRGNTGPMIFLNYVSWPLFALFSLPRLRGKYDAVLCYNTSPVLMSFPAILYAKLHRVPLTNYVLDIWPENLYSVLPVKNKVLRSIAQAVSNWHYRRADRLIAMSDSLRRRLAQVSRKPEESIAVIPQYCEDFYAAPADPGQLAEQFAGRFNLVFTGNFSPAQSLDTVIEAACIARDKGADDLHLLGQRGPHRDPRLLRGGRRTGLSLGRQSRPGHDGARQAGQLYGQRQAGAGQHHRRGSPGGGAGGLRFCQQCQRRPGSGGKQSHYQRSQLLDKLRDFVLEGRQ